MPTPRVPRPSKPATDPRPGLSGLSEGVLEAWLAAGGQPAYRARQIRDGVWRRNGAAAD